MSDDGKKKEGIQAALDVVGPGVAGDARPADQLPLLPAEGGVDDDGEEIRPPEGPGRGPGRPKGAKNRRTEEWTDFILSRYRSPLVVLAETYSRPVGDLARELGCKREEAFKVQVECAKAVAPYVHERQPVAVKVEGGIVSLVLEAPQAGPTGAGGDDAMIVEGEIIEEGEESKGDEKQ